MMGDDPPYLSVGTEVSAKYKGAFCEAKIRKVVKSVKCKILFKHGLGMASVGDDVVKGNMRVGSSVEARHPDKKEFVEGTITKIQDCSQYTVVFDDGDITTLRRTALCLKSGRHFAESETLDQLPLTHPEHFGNPVMGGRRGRRRGGDEESDEEETGVKTKVKEEKEADIGRVVCVEGDKKKQRDNWFPGLVVSPTAQDTVRIHVREEYLVRSFKDGRYYTVPKKETTEFTREAGAKVDNHSVKAAVEKALLFLDKDELPPHWDRELLFGLNAPSNFESDQESDSDNPDDEPREEKDHFVAQLYKFMDDRGTPINQGPTICSKDVDLYRLFYVVHNLGGYNRVTNHNHWKTVSSKLGYGQAPANVNLVKQVYKRFLHSFEEFYRKLGCTMVSHPRTYRNRSRAGRSLIRDKDRLSGGGKSESKERSDCDEPEEINQTEDVRIKEERVSSVEPILTPIKQKVDIKEDPAIKKSTEKEKDKLPAKMKEEKEKMPVKMKEEKEKLPVKMKEEKEKLPVKMKEEKEKLPVKMKEEKEKLPVKMKEEKEKMPAKIKEEKEKLPVKMKDDKDKIPVKTKEDKDKVPVKIKEEKEEEVKEKSEPIKEKTRMRTKMKSNESLPLKKEIKKEVEEKEETKPIVEKKKRLFTRALKREKMSLMKSGPGIALTRKKRAIKERVKAIFDKFKFTKDSSSVASDSSEKSVTTNKEKPIKVKEEPPAAPPPVCIKKEEPEKEKEPIPVLNEEKKKVGRKKKEKKDHDEVFDSLPTYKTVCVGDKLKVYYGPTNESKVTYEAKVLSIKTEGQDVMYRVHYTGWNNRYDEYIKHSRIADNLSWVPGRASKKPALSFLKPGRRKNSISKVESLPIKSEGGNGNKIDGKTEEPMNKMDVQNSNGKNQFTQSNIQNKTGKLVAVTRSSWRNSRRDDATSDNEMEEDIDFPIPSLYLSVGLLNEKTQSEKVKEILGISDESSLISVADRRKTKKRGSEETLKLGEGKAEPKGSGDLTNVEDKPQSPKIDRRKKRSHSESENLENTEKRTRQISRRRRSSSATEDKSDTNISCEADSSGSGDEKKRTRKRSSGLDSPDSSGSLKKKRFADKKFEGKSSENNSQQSFSVDEESVSKTSSPEVDEASKGRDFDLIQIRSELKGLDKAVKAEAESFMSIASDIKTASEKKAEADKLAEDIYEFKEPEPFEFEVRKSSEDKGKSLQRRTLGARFFDDSKKHSSVLLPNIFYKGKKEVKVEEQKKTFLNAVYTFEEESCDKVTSSPRQSETDEPSCKPFQLFTELPDEELKKSPDPLNVTFTVSKSEIFNTTYTKPDEPSSPPSASPKSNSIIDAEMNDNSNFDSNEVESTSKSCFSRDEDEDELEDESINFAIQRAIKQEISDDEDVPNDPPNLISMESSIFPVSEGKLSDKPVIVESIEDKDDLENCVLLDKADKSECDDKSEDQLSNSTESDEESDFILTSLDREDDKDESDKNDMESVTTLVSSPVIMTTSVVADNVVISGEELVSTSSIMTPIIVPPDVKEDSMEYAGNDDEQVGEALYPISPVSSKCLEEPVTESIETNDQLDDNNSDQSTQELETITSEIHEETVKIEADREFTFKPITVPPPDDSESTVSVPFNESKSSDEIIINLEPLMKPLDEDKMNNDDEVKTDLNLPSLLCEETIPGSPSSHMECCEQTEEEKTEPAPAEIIEEKVERVEVVMSHPIVEEIVRMEEVGETETGENTDSSKSTRECEDTENYAKESDEERQVDKSPSKLETSNSRKNVSCTKRTRPTKKRHCEYNKKRYSRRQMGSDSDDTSENSNTGGFSQSNVITADNDAKELPSGDCLKPPCRYNFLVGYDSTMDQNSRISLIQASILQIRKVYADLKSELAVIDRRRKKLRKRERESLAAVRLH